VLREPWVWVAALTALAFLLRRYQLGAESFWFDEADIVWRARQPLGSLVLGFTQAGENGPFYTLLMHLWLGLMDALPVWERALHVVFGPNDEAPVRALSTLFGTAAIPLMYAVARRVGGVPVGLAAATLLTFNPFHIWHSQDAKMYSLLVLTTLACTLLYLEAFERNTMRLWAGYVACTWVMLTVHSMAVLVLLAHIVAAPLMVANASKRKLAPARHDSRSLWVRWGWSMLLIAAPLLPIAWLRVAALLTGTADVGGWYSPAGLADMLQVIFVKFSVNEAGPVWEAAGAITMAALALTGALALIRSRSANTSAAGKMLVLLWLLPMSVFWLVTLKVPLFQARYLIMALPAYLIMAATGLIILRRVHLLAVALPALVLAAASFSALVGVNYSPRVTKEDWRGAMAYVQDHLRLRDVIVVFPGYLITAVEQYYRPGGPALVPQVDVRPVPSLHVKNFGQRELEAALNDIVRCHERAWLVTSPPRQAQEDPNNKVQEWFQYNWHTFDTQVFNGVTVYGIAFNGQPDCWYPAPVYKEVHTFENGLQFLGYIYELRDQSDHPVQPDASYFPLTMYWRTPHRLSTDYVVHVYVKDQSGMVIKDEALGPLNGYWPTSQWPPNTTIIDYRDIRLPGGMEPGPYMVSIQVYPRGQPDRPLKLQDGSTEIVLRTPLQVVPWQP
jgi:uncharacterized membrane protein